MSRQGIDCDTPDCIYWDEENGCIKETGVKIQEHCCLDYEPKKEKPRITIVVSGGMVQNVFTTLETEMEVDVLDFDDNGDRSDDEREDMEKYLERVTSENCQIY